MLSKIKQWLDKRELRRMEMHAYQHMQRITLARPLNINIETSSICNSRCCFCAYRKVKRKNEVMSMELFHSIVEQYAQMGGPLGFSPLLSDSLMDVHILERIEKVLSYGDVFWTHMFTNAIGFSRFSDKELEHFLKLDFINISMSGPDAQSYRIMYGVDRFDDVVTNIRRLVSLREAMQSKTKIAVHFRVVNPNALRASDLFEEFCRYGLLLHDVCNVFSNFGGYVSQEDVPEGVVVNEVDNSQKKENCLIPHTEFTVCPNGDVIGCGCFDVDGATVMGNLHEKSIVEIWKSEKHCCPAKGL